MKLHDTLGPSRGNSNVYWKVLGAGGSVKIVYLLLSKIFGIEMTLQPFVGLTSSEFL